MIMVVSIYPVHFISSVSAQLSILYSRMKPEIGPILGTQSYRSSGVKQTGPRPSQVITVQ